MLHVLRFKCQYSVQPSAALVALGAVISLPKPRHVIKTASVLMGKQLFRPDGVQGLCAALFGESSSDLDLDESISLEKMQRFARIIGTVPGQLTAEASLLSLFPFGQANTHFRHTSPPSYPLL